MVADASVGTQILSHDPWPFGREIPDPSLAAPAALPPGLTAIDAAGYIPPDLAQRILVHA
jgi:hypothetical protein